MTRPAIQTIFRALANYSPYHQARNGVAYPATMLISGDCDTSCNPLHARKMTAWAAGGDEFPLSDDSQLREVSGPSTCASPDRSHGVSV
jgi:hypothetical protein